MEYHPHYDRVMRSPSINTLFYYVGSRMGYTLSDLSTSHDNNFNLIRLTAAFLVLYSHSYSIVTGDSSTQPLFQSLGLTWGYIAVDVFFISSGFLVSNSLFTRSNIITFAWARILRVYPALIMSLIFCAGVLGLYFTTLTPWEYLSHKKTLFYVLRNGFLFFDIDAFLPEVFSDNPLGSKINGSLWTLPYEVKAYSSLGLLWFISLLIKRKFTIDFFKNVVVVITLLGLLLHLTSIQLPGMDIHSTRLYTLFFLGVAIFVFQRHVTLSTPAFLIIMTVLLTATIHQYSFFVFYTLSIAYIVLYLAYIPHGKIRLFNKLGDYSYGVYIYAFPVQQAIIALFTTISIIGMVILSSIITLSLSVLSWHLLEKHCLRLKH